MHNKNNIIYGRNFVIISSIDWKDNWQMHQQLAVSIRESGGRVLFIENTGVRSIKLGDFGRIRSRLKNRLNSYSGFWDDREGITVFSPLVLPMPYSSLAITLNSILLNFVLRRWIKSNRFENPIVISFLPTRLAKNITNALDPILSIYYCANDMSGGSMGASRLAKDEKSFFSFVDAVFCISKKLLERAGAYNNHIFMIPPGVSTDFFCDVRLVNIPKDLIDIRRPIVGYVGSISNVFDVPMLIEAARAMPSVSFVLIGPHYINLDRIRLEKNIHILGPRPHSQILGYLTACDALIIPYLINSYTDCVYTCKLNEYLAVGKPVVATKINEINLYAEKYPGVISVVKNTDEFVSEVRRCLESSEDESMVNKRILVAKLNSWSSRFVDFQDALCQILNKRASLNENWLLRFMSSYGGLKKIFFRVASTFLVVSLIVFHTPLFWHLGRYLVINDSELEPSNVIMVFSGYGESSYFNSSYQKRALETINLYDKKFSNLIYIGSGRELYINDGKLIQAILIDHNVPQENIYLHSVEVKNTMEAVRGAGIFLKKKKMTTAIFITSKYHSRRSALIWKKMYPDLKITYYSDEAQDFDLNSQKWRPNFDDVAVIAYEYIAIAYYRFKGWI